MLKDERRKSEVQHFSKQHGKHKHKSKNTLTYMTKIEMLKKGTINE